MVFKIKGLEPGPCIICRLQDSGIRARAVPAPARVFIPDIAAEIQVYLAFAAIPVPDGIMADMVIFKPVALVGAPVWQSYAGIVAEQEAVRATADGCDPEALRFSVSTT